MMKHCQFAVCFPVICKLPLTRVYLYAICSFLTHVGTEGHSFGQRAWHRSRGAARQGAIGSRAVLGADAAKIHITFLLGAPASSSLLLHRALCLQGGRELSTAPVLQRAPAKTLRLGVTLLLLHQLLHMDLFENKPFIFANKDLMTNKASLPFFQAVNVL